MSSPFEDEPKGVPPLLWPLSDGSIFTVDPSNLLVTSYSGSHDVFSHVCIKFGEKEGADGRLKGEGYVFWPYDPEYRHLVNYAEKNGLVQDHGTDVSAGIRKAYAKNFFARTREVDYAYLGHLVNASRPVVLGDA